ncbi:Hypothetical protein NGAL_HAMBI2605_59030 [Neorhizobium galegae bv. orientalis]|nr:Hypothetical protein NGAL_HAMBI2605_59030 [Neorhizobium galegae bv. orientalis]
MVSVAVLLAGCSPTVSAPEGEGAGYERLTPNAITRGVIFKQDPQFTNQVAAHNAQCAKDPLCKK